MRRKLLSYFMVVLALVLTAAFYIWFDLEGIIWDRQEPVELTADQIKKEKGKDYTGRMAGKGIPELTSKKEWEKFGNGSGYATIIPEDIEKTGVYSLGKWTDYYTKKKKGSSEEKRDDAISPFLDYSAEYTPFYIITLKDGTKILAQMNRGIAKSIARGNEEKLPIGKKTEVSKKARELLKAQCKKENVSVKYVFYTVNNAWEKEHADEIFWGKIGITIFVFIILAIFLQVVERSLARALFKPDKKEELKGEVAKLSVDDEDRFFREAGEDEDDEEETI